MSEANTRYTTNPVTGRRIRIGGVAFNRLIFESHDFINGELVRRETAPPLAPRTYYYNTVTERLIRYGTRTYFELIRAGWDIEEDYYLVPPEESHAFQDAIAQTLAIVRETGQGIAQRRTQRNTSRNPITYEGLMAVHGERLANLNISLCRECFYPLKAEEGEYCDSCKP